MISEIKVFAPASVANVSCGFDVLGFCLDPIGDLIHVKMTEKPGVHIGNIKGYKVPKNPLKNVASVAVNALLKSHPTKNGFIISIEKKIKPGSGIGSSAASSAGAVFAVNELLGRPFKSDKLLDFAMFGEALASGEYHADNLAPVLFGGFTLVRSINPIDIVSLPYPPELIVTIIHPKIELKTIHSRAILKDDIPLKKAIKQWGNLGALVSALYTNNYNLLSRSLQDELIEPARSILIPRFEEVKNKALNQGALGSGISGSGPSIFALSKGMATAKKAGNAMAEIYKSIGLEYDMYLSPINKVGIKILK